MSDERHLLRLCMRPASGSELCPDQAHACRRGSYAHMTHDDALLDDGDSLSELPSSARARGASGALPRLAHWSQAMTSTHDRPRDTDLAGALYGMPCSFGFSTYVYSGAPPLYGMSSQEA